MFKNTKLKTMTMTLLVLFLLSVIVSAVLNVMSLNALSADVMALATVNGVEGVVGKMLSKHQTMTIATSIITTLIAIVLVIVMSSMLLSGVLTPLRQLSVHFSEMANGDLTQRIEDQGTNEVGQVFSSLEAMQRGLAAAFMEIQQSASRLHVDSEMISTGNTSLSARIEQQGAALQQTAASMEELSGTVRQNADNAHQANQLAATASTVAQRGGEVVGEVVSTMEGITDSANKIAEIVGVIDSIAFQTNILALNAAVEAARAGEQGRGFAVVASEVRALAQRSASAASEITVLIEDSGKKVSEGSAQVERAGATMSEIVDSVRRVTDIMGEISAATIEQSTGIDQINMAVSQLDSTTIENAAMVSQNATTAADMFHQVDVLNEVLATFNADRRTVHAPSRVVSSAPASTAKRTTSLPATNKPNAKRTVTAYSAPEQRSAAKPTTKRAVTPKNTANIPGMNMTSGGAKDEPLLRPDLSKNKPAVSSRDQDEWVEF